MKNLIILLALLFCSTNSLFSAGKSELRITNATYGYSGDTILGTATMINNGPDTFYYVQNFLQIRVIDSIKNVGVTFPLVPGSYTNSPPSLLKPGSSVVYNFRIKAKTNTGFLSANTVDIVVWPPISTPNNDTFPGNDSIIIRKKFPFTSILSNLKSKIEIDSVKVFEKNPKNDSLYFKFNLTNKDSGNGLESVYDAILAPMEFDLTIYDSTLGKTTIISIDKNMIFPTGPKVLFSNESFNYNFMIRKDKAFGFTNIGKYGFVLKPRLDYPMTIIANTNSIKNGSFKVDTIGVSAAISIITDQPIHFYPNPFKTSATIESEDNAKIISIDLYTLNGMKIELPMLRSENKMLLDFTKLNSGNYIIMTTDEKGNKSFKKIEKE